MAWHNHNHTDKHSEIEESHLNRRKAHCCSEQPSSLTVERKKKSVRQKKGTRDYKNDRKVTVCVIKIIIIIISNSLTG